MDRNANRIANQNHEEAANCRHRYGGGHIRRGARRLARAYNKAARRIDRAWAFKTGAVS
jgi:hypothetical protein